MLCDSQNILDQMFLVCSIDASPIEKKRNILIIGNI